MKRTLLPTVLLLIACLVAPAGASARVVELGADATAVTPSCPANPCEAAVRVTGLQGRSAGGRKNPYYIRRNGWVVAFTVQLSSPTEEQIDFFDDNFGSPSQVRLAVLRRGDTRRTRLNYRLLAESPDFELSDYFGSSPTFALEEPLRVRKGNWIAVTVDTWAPMFARDLARQDWWRASRAKNSCEQPRSFNQFAIEDLREVATFGCTYKTARLLYTATYIPDNRPTTTDDGDS
jgi:hypothetical protein